MSAKPRYPDSRTGPDNPDGPSILENPLTRPRQPLAIAATLVTAALLLAACGSDSDTASPPAGDGDARTIEIEMSDNAFSPQAVDVQAGETVRFVFDNTGAVTHDAFIGDEAAQDDHGSEMNGGGDGGMSGMDHASSDDSGGITVEPGETGELMHTFESGDEVLIGCHQPGHYEAGMMLSMTVG